MNQDTFIELVQQICKRPSMYTRGSVKETIAFIDGYRWGATTPISDRFFDRYVCIRNSFPDNYVWGAVIHTCARDDKEAFKLIEEIIVEFVTLRKNKTDDELIQYAKEQQVEEGEAEKIFREFNTALFKGDKPVIRSLIEEHPDASILWETAYPADTGILLNDIFCRQPVRSIPLPEDGKQLKIIAQGWPFPIEMNCKDGKWKINAEKIIELWKKR